MSDKEVTRDELRVAVFVKLKWMVTGSGPEIRSEADMRAILNWIDKAIDALPVGDQTEWSFDASMLASVMGGDMEIVGAQAAGEVLFKVTAQGEQTATSALMNDPEMLRFYQSLNKGAAVDGPKKPQ